MENLPDEILEYIFDYISTYELIVVTATVCRRWNRMIRYRVMRVESLEQLESPHDGLKALMVTKPVVNLDAAILMGARVVDTLRELTICKAYPLDEHDYRTLISMKHLKHLDVFSKSMCLDRNTLINPTITTLVVNENIGKGFMKNIAVMTKLTGFHMYGRSRYCMAGEMLVFLLLQSIYLRELTLRCSELQNDAKYGAVGACVRLRSLQLHNCSVLTRDSIVHFIKLTELRRFHITGARMLRSGGLLALINSLPPLIEDLNLSCSDFGDEHCNPLICKLPNLKRLELWRCKVSSGELVKLVMDMKVLQELDTDVCFDSQQMHSLELHPSLRKLRCRWNGLILPNLNITSALQQYCKEYLRDDCEGPSADLFYFWTRAIDPKSFDPHTHPHHFRLS